MRIPTFPPELPRPQVSGFRRQRSDPRRRRTFDAGPPKFARRYSAVPVTFSLSMRLHAWQVALFDRFYVEDCADGSLPFYMPDYTVDGLPLRDLRLPTDVLILEIMRDGQTIVPHGFSNVRVGDEITVIGSPNSLTKVMLKLSS